MLPDLSRPSSAVIPVRRVLVVDDHVDAAELLGEWLEFEGFEVQCTHDGAQALQCWAQQRAAGEWRHVAVERAKIRREKKRNRKNVELIY